MRLDRFTSKLQIAISDAQSLALGRDHQYIEPVHLMTALLNQQGGSVPDDQLTASQLRARAGIQSNSTLPLFSSYSVGH